MVTLKGHSKGHFGSAFVIGGTVIVIIIIKPFVSFRESNFHNIYSIMVDTMCHLEGALYSSISTIEYSAPSG